MNKKLKKILKVEAKKAAKRERLHGIDPKSYLGQEILKQGREIIKLRHSVDDLIVLIKKERDVK